MVQNINTSEEHNLNIDLVQHLQMLSISKKQLEEQREKLKQLEKEINSFIKDTSIHCYSDCSTCTLTHICHSENKGKLHPNKPSTNA